MSILIKNIILLLLLLNLSIEAKNNTANSYLTDREKEWIKKQKIITARVSSFAPLHFMDENIPKGISKEYLDYIAKTVGLEIKYVTNIPWPKALDSLKNNDKTIDLLLTAGYSKERALIMNFSLPYIKPPLVIFTKNDNNTIQSIKHLMGKTIAIEKNYIAYSLIKNQYPKIKLKVYRNTIKSLEALSLGKVDAYIGTLLTANHKIKQHGFNNIKIAGPTPFPLTEISFGIRSGLPYLKSIINKTLLQMDQAKRNDIESKWLSIKYEKTSYKFLIIIVSILMLIILIVLTVNNKLKKEIKQRKESDRLFKLIFDQAAMGVVLLDMNTFSYVRVNKRYCDILHMDLEEALKQDYMKLTHPEDLEETKHYNKLLRDEVIDEFDIEKRYLLKNNEIIWIHITYKATWEPKSTKRYAIAIVEDITQRKELERTKAEKENLLFQQSKLASMGEMIGNIAHQWRQPLSVISTMATGLKLKHEMKELKENDLIDFADGINNSAQHLSKTIDNFRNFYKPNHEEEYFNIKECINKAISLVSAQFNSKSITIIQTIKEEELFGLENELIQVIINILNNARDALCENNIVKKYIFIETSIANNEYIIDIYDNANGIADNIIKKVFEPYFTTKHQSQGTGIGLYMSEEIIIKHMRGKLEVSNKSYEYEGNNYIGASFKIILSLSK